MPHQGSCLCGKVTFTVEGDLPMLSACHCTACRRQSGHFESSVDIPRTALAVAGIEHVTWYHSSRKVRRGFCTHCGSTLFWDPVFRDWTAVAMGAFDTPTGTQITQHIFVSDKGDYYQIDDGLPQNAQ